MKKSVFLAIVWGLVISPQGRAQGSATEFFIETGFEAGQGYSLGDLNGQQGWSVESGSAEVWTQTIYSGSQAARIAPSGSITRGYPATASVVTFQGFFQATPSLAPEIPSSGQAVVLYMDSSHGLTGLDGDGQGGGNWVGSGIAIPAGTWFELTVVVDFLTKSWECSVNGSPALRDLHFHSDSVVGSRSLEVAANDGDTVLDQLSVSASGPPPPATPDLISAVPFTVGFEPQEGFATGNLDSQNGWAVDAGQAEVWTRTVYSGVQAARIAPGATISHEFATGLPVTTFSAYLQATPSSTPEIPLAGQAAVLYLDAVHGLTGLNGDGNGGGSWVGSDVVIPSGTWFQLTLNLDFASKTWGCLVNGQPALSGLRFHSDNVAVFGSMVAAASGGDTLLDAAMFAPSSVPTPPSPPPSPVPVSTFPFGLGFEPAEGYLPGDLEGQNGWTVDTGQAEIWTRTVYSGVQAARIEPGGEASRGFATALPLITFQAYLQATASPTPEIPSAAQAAILYLDPTYGLTGLDGDGSGGGNWVGSGVVIAPGTWFELTLKLDLNRKSWDCLIDGRPALSGLHFHSDDIIAFGSIVAAAPVGDTLLDAARVDVADAAVPTEFSVLESRHGFEPEEGYFLGSLDRQNGWTVENGESQVWSNAVYSGVQAARIEPGARISQTMVMASPIVIFDGYLRANPSEAPEIPGTAQIAVIYLDATQGITGLDGDGNGGGNWVGSGMTVPGDTWFRATVRVDFASKTWSCAINGTLALVNMHFHANSISTFSSFAASGTSTGVTLLDQLSFIAESGSISVPSLTIGITGTDVEISWPADAFGYRLQVATSLGEPNWTEVVTSGNRISEKPDQALRFYRLVAP